MSSDKDRTFLRMAYTVAELSTCSRLHVGAIIVQGDNPISVGFNGAARGEIPCDHSIDFESPCEITLHAESNALIFCDQSKRGSTMYITHAPCFRCAGLIINAKLGRVVFSEIYRSADGLERLTKRGIECTQFSEVDY